MNEPVKCNKCNDTEWVCENHPNQEAHKCIHCGGAGMPCECTNSVNPYQSITDTKIEPTVVSYTRPAKEQGNPVAWRSQSPDGYWSVYQAPVEGAEPLYTGFKELSGVEIIGMSGKYDFTYEVDIIDFVRACIRKAQEK